MFAYLRHPWPTTQVLAAALAPLPDSITLHQIRLYDAEPAVTVGVIAANSNSSPKKPAVESEPAAKRDLEKLRDDHDNRPRVLLLIGTTSDTAGLQNYLLTLGKSELFVKTELGSIEGDSSNAGAAMRFTARLVVRPGYGQSGGPTSAPASESLKRLQNVSYESTAAK